MNSTGGDSEGTVYYEGELKGIVQGGVGFYPTIYIHARNISEEDVGLYPLLN